MDKHLIFLVVDFLIVLVEGLDQFWTDKIEYDFVGDVANGKIEVGNDCFNIVKAIIVSFLILKGFLVLCSFEEGERIEVHFEMGLEGSLVETDELSWFDREGIVKVGDCDDD
mgnify:CR=1 FL=1